MTNSDFDFATGSIKWPRDAFNPIGEREWDIVGMYHGSSAGGSGVGATFQPGDARCAGASALLSAFAAATAALAILAF